jgi:hypothetical protein
MEWHFKSWDDFLPFLILIVLLHFGVPVDFLVAGFFVWSGVIQMIYKPLFEIGFEDFNPFYTFDLPSPFHYLIGFAEIMFALVILFWYSKGESIVHAIDF